MASDQIRFDDRVILVTGGAGGLGQAYCRLLASRGAKVVVADNGSRMDGSGGEFSRADAVATEIAGAGGEAVGCPEDLSTEQGAIRAVEAALDTYGQIDGILHNASTVPDLTLASELSSHDIDLVMRINAHAGLWMARAAWPYMQRHSYGRIVLTTSVGIYGSEGTTAYSAAKAANVGIMRCLAQEGGRQGILVNVVAPSARSRMTERFLEAEYAEWFMAAMPPEKVAVAAAYLMSETCRINGEIIVLGGGRIARMQLAETHGVMGEGASIEEVHGLMPTVMADENRFFPAGLPERSAAVAELLGK